MQLQVEERHGAQPVVKLGPERYTRKPTDIFQRIWNIEGVKPQKVLHKQNGKTIDQYFFVDSRNKIQLLYPNYKKKIDVLRLIEYIAEQRKIRQMDNTKFKRINCITRHPEETCHHDNTIRNIENLRMLMNLDHLHCAQSISFNKDKDSMILYISEPKSRDIVLYRMKDNFCEFCDYNNDPNMQMLIGK